jgi:hypothetical protein
VSSPNGPTRSPEEAQLVQPDPAPRDTAAAQLEYAHDLRAPGKLRKAGKAYRALVITWPGSAQAPEAQYGYAQMLDARGKLLDAFDEYEILMTRFVGGFPYDAVLQRQFEIGQSVMNRRRGSFLLFGGFQAPERAVPLFEASCATAPAPPSRRRRSTSSARPTS